VPGGGNGQTSGQGTNAVIKRCPKDTVAKNAWCHCADDATSFNASTWGNGQQGALIGIMFQKVAPPLDYNQEPTAGLFCDMSSPDDANNCIQAECRGGGNPTGAFCKKVVLTLVCGPPLPPAP
jgi:hypothetical protein